VDRPIKGNLAVGSLVDVEYGPLMAGFPEKFAGEYGVWFLQSSRPGIWRALPAGDTHAPLILSYVCYPVPKEMPPPTRTRQELPPDDLVAAELTSAVEQLDYRGQEFYMLALGLLKIPPSDEVASRFRRLLKSSDPQVRVLGEVGLVKQGDLAAIKNLPHFQETLMKSNLRVQLLSGLAMLRASDPATASALGSLATSSEVLGGIQFAAAQSLRAVHTKEALPFLAELLNSPEARIRHEGLAGLSMFVENLPVQLPELMPSYAWVQPQGPAPYRTEATDYYSAKFKEREGKQEEYVAFWKTWWETMKTRIEAQPAQPGTAKR
jgi:hypothetical protein